MTQPHSAPPAADAAAPVSTCDRAPGLGSGSNLSGLAAANLNSLDHSNVWSRHFSPPRQIHGELPPPPPPPPQQQQQQQQQQRPRDDAGTACDPGAEGTGAGNGCENGGKTVGSAGAVGGRRPSRVAHAVADHSAGARGGGGAVAPAAAAAAADSGAGGPSGPAGPLPPKRRRVKPPHRCGAALPSLPSSPPPASSSPAPSAFLSISSEMTTCVGVPLDLLSLFVGEAATTVWGGPPPCCHSLRPPFLSSLSNGVNGCIGWGPFGSSLILIASTGASYVSTPGEAATTVRGLAPPSFLLCLVD